jgi:drug/metabolite transporter (DMT)-like permease
MITWISLVIVGHFFGALSVMGDKFLISDRQLKSPMLYAFYVSILSGFVIFMVPFGSVSIPSSTVLLLSLAVSASYIISILLLYTSLKSASAAEVIPLIGAITAIFTFILKLFFFSEVLPDNFFLASLFLVTGMALISHFDFPRKIFWYIVGAGLLFGLSSILAKEIFEITTFADGFFWTRMANVFGALLLLLIPANFRQIFGKKNTPGTKTSLFVIGNKIIGSLAFILIFYAISIGNVSLINALAGLQFVFLFIFTIIFSKQFPRYFGGKITDHEIIHKIIAISIILIGFFILFS